MNIPHYQMMYDARAVLHAVASVNQTDYARLDLQYVLKVINYIVADVCDAVLHHR